ncbi:MAG: two-component sensor histidine kinase [Myxococcaceae bacterium]|jgi:two-component system sensor histidine kinase ResE|nr:two-component sensor histidine kinase [Myxococcaceae bacterium]
MLEKALAAVRRTLLRQKRPDPRVHVAAAHQVGRISRIFRDVVELEKLRAGEAHLRLAAHPIEPLLEGAISRHAARAAERSISLVIEPASAPVTAWCDPERIARVLFHLVDNAIGASSEGGEVVLSSAVRGRMAVVSVTDCGQGIPIEEWPYLFEEWRSPHHRDRLLDGQEHDGLGLSLCRGLVEAHGGRIWVMSRLRVGTTFHFAVPAPPLTS